MIVTQTVAKTMQCPRFQDGHCIGSNCMWWRWSFSGAQLETLGDGRLAIVNAGVPTGFCGAGGTPYGAGASE